MPLTRRLSHLAIKVGSPAFRRFVLKLLPFPDLQKLREIVDLMDKTSVDIFQSKKAAIEKGEEAVLAQIGRGKDIMSILCEQPFGLTHNRN